ncbi:hypothetical protein SAMN04487771_100595 [[Clostridium] aminophilum]|uniref:DUF4365 domain-containing protein n=1 Tax=[Clostridium] aminophilum TaxID=1526 RepID=A0A1I0BZ89_9FIRM|nr:hypothetical protein [[Clostridium] aminophilum]SET12519.1 hypothetical protein SAMN04487771_100595 [[Clostridium] aminophilum]
MTAGMAIHSNSSFNEGKAVRYLEEVLEQGNKIKTFFKENDRTPNYDGTFELISKNGEPKKQFIVQIKKTKALPVCQSGKNSGKRVYQLETAFLYYVKAKVTESPAIYFVVDIENNRIFYLYLSDELLMKLDFEGKKRVTYAFSEQDVLNDINVFCDRLFDITKKRNEGFIYKTEDEIVEIQEALDYINDLFNGDLKEIKKACYPNLWRFGVGVSTGECVTLSFKNNKGSKVDNSFINSSMFCIYPQYKGEIGNSISEYRSNGFGTHIDCTGTKKPIEYVKDEVKEVIVRFCENPPAKLLPSTLLEERVYEKAKALIAIFGSEEEILVDDVLIKYNILLSYLYMIFSPNYNATDAEKQFKRIVSNQIRIPGNGINFSNPMMKGIVRGELLNYYNSKPAIKFNSKFVLQLLSKASIELFVDLEELKERGVKKIHNDWYERRCLVYQDDIDSVKKLYNEWLKKLPDSYHDMYKMIFGKNYEYMFSCNVEFSINKCSESGILYDEIINTYKSNDDISISLVDYINPDFRIELEESVISKTHSSVLGRIISSGNPLYDGVRCWLYQGICQKLGLKCEGLKLNFGIRTTIFSN